MIHLTFDTEQEAITALAQVDSNKGYAFKGRNASTNLEDPVKGVTTSWALIRKADDLSKWFFVKPSIEFMDKVVDYKEEEYSKDWSKPLDGV